MKKLFKFLFMMLLLFCLYKSYQNKEEITDYLVDLYIDNKKITIEENNNYKRDYNFNYVQETTNFRPNNYKELLNIFYTILNNGWEKFTFYCGKEYDNCLQDIKLLTDDNTILSNINNYVHPYNSYQSVYIYSNSLGQVDVTVNKLYSEEDIKQIEDNINFIINENITSDMSDKEKIEVIHDYIINNTVYDKEQERTVYSNGRTIYKYASNKALGPVLFGKAICGGYTDYMQLFLEKFGIKSYKISTDKHIWNYVYIDNEYKHLDLTWDDPIVYNASDGTITPTLSHKYFLIDTDELLSLDKTEHNYNTEIFRD